MRSRAHDEPFRPETGPDPDAARARAVELVREHAQSSAALWYRLGMLGGQPLPTSWIVRGVDEAFVRRRVEERIGWPHADPRLPDPRWDRRFVPMSRVVDRDRLLGSPLHERCHAPAGVHDLVRMVVYHQGRFVGWIGALRTTGEPPFGAADLRRLAPLAADVAAALVAADEAERARPEGACDLVLRRDGTIDLASPGARALLLAKGARDEVRRWAAEVESRGDAPELLRGQRVRWSRLTGASGVRYLLQLEPVPPVLAHPSAVLSAAQREIASLAAAGATVDDVARLVGVSRSTVRTHLRLAYERLGVASRAELARALATPDGP